MCLGAQKNRLIETVLLSTHNICFGLEIRKLIFHITCLSGGLTAHKILVLMSCIKDAFTATVKPV